MKDTPIIWWGSSYDDLQDLGEEVKDIVGHALGLIQQGEKPDSITKLKGNLRNVMEIHVEEDKDTYRTMYTVAFEGVVYVLDAFKKKSKRGRETPQPDLDRIWERFKRVREHYKANGPPEE